MSKGLRKSDLNDTEARKKKRASRRTRLIGGQNVNIDTQPDTYQILSAFKKNKISTGENSSLNEKAEILLGTLDCAVVSEGKKYSLITTCGDAEAIENENILDPTSYDVRPEAISAKDKFTNVNDPFYNLDDDIPDRYSIMNSSFATRNLPDFVCFTAKLDEVSNNVMNGALSYDEIMNGSLTPDEVMNSALAGQTPSTRAARTRTRRARTRTTTNY